MVIFELVCERYFLAKNTPEKSKNEAEKIGF